MTSERGAEALIFAVPTLGHVNHAIALARFLASAGLRSHLVTAPGMADHLTRVAAGISWTAHEAFDLRFGPRRTDGRSHFMQIFDPDHVQAAFTATAQLVDAVRPALIVTKDFVAPLMAASALGVASASYLTDGIAPIVDATVRQRVLPEQMADDFLELAASLRTRSVAQACLTSAGAGDLILARGYPELDGPAPPWAASRLLHLGALVFDGSEQQITAWRRSIARSSRPLIYVNLGTVAYDAEPYRRIVLGLGPLQASVLLVSLHITEEQIGPLPPNVRLERYVPNAAALSAADLMVHHGGHGGLLSSLIAGVPSLVLPQNTHSTAQAWHAETVSRLGVGLDLPAAASPEQIGSAAQSILGGEFRCHAKELASRLAARSEALQVTAAERISEVIRAKSPPYTPRADLPLS